MFGSGKKEEFEALQAQVAALTQERDAAISQHDDLIDAREVDRQTIALHEATAASNRDTIDRLRDDLEANRAANAIGVFALAELRKAQDSGEVMVSSADLAREVVAKRLIEQTTAEQTNQLLAEEEREQRRNFGPDEIKHIRANLDETFKGDGTYTRLGNKIELDVRDEVRAELLAEESARVEAELAQPAQREAMVALERQKLEESGELAELRQQTIGAAMARLETEAREKAMDEILQAIEAAKDQIVAEYLSTWKDSAEGREYFENALIAAREVWTKAGKEAIAKELGDEATLQALQELNEKTKRKLEKKNVLADFGLTGLDISKFTEDSQVTFYFGEQGMFTGKTTSGEVITDPVEGVKCVRIIKVTSMGGARYILNHDSCNRQEVGAVLGFNRKIIQFGKLNFSGGVGNGAGTKERIMNISLNGSFYDTNMKIFID